MDIDIHLSKSLEPAQINNQKVGCRLAFGSVAKIIDRVRNNRQLDIFGKKFKVSKNLIYSYVKLKISIFISPSCLQRRRLSPCLVNGFVQAPPEYSGLYLLDR